jgi:ATP-dependent Clp protease ATP-binding subunit ClpB
MHLQWTNERDAINSIREKKARLEQLKTEEQMAERQRRPEQGRRNQAWADSLADQGDIRQELRPRSSADDGRQLLREEVSDDDVARIVSNWTGVPVAKMLASEMEKYVHLEDTLSQVSIGRTKRSRRWRTPSGATRRVSVTSIGL